MAKPDDQRDKQTLVPLQEFRGPRERLTEAQARVLAALSSSYTVCMSSHAVSVPYHDQVLIGNGSRLSPATIESLKWRGLIEEAGRELEPSQPGYPEHWRKQLLFFRLTQTGRMTVLRQALHFTPEEVIFSLPYRVELLLEELNRYEIRYHCEPEVAIRGVIPSERFNWQVRLPTWRIVVVYNEADNLLGVAGGKSGENEAMPLWVRPGGHGWNITSLARVRLRPKTSTPP
ncbi:hypothetical protein KDA_75440 [Dictyobacter alpinus]|uniref:Uncharacterized protein n=1 Tax=Dictyobacter alpinus TaxID=2014873 RepID=A0A402BL68_9CHLR|nr:hypothetical protein [Dictyobacter alpinus]GCE32060.1 hypothetical protein KDA_75440 [Dictyobacter alpinus]